MNRDSLAAARTFVPVSVCCCIITERLWSFLEGFSMHLIGAEKCVVFTGSTVVVRYSWRKFGVKCLAQGLVGRFFTLSGCWGVGTSDLSVTGQTL